MHYIVEHMEEELFTWSQLEYAHIRSHVGNSQFWLTHLPNIDSTSFPIDHTRYFDRSITDLGLPSHRICLLDSEAEQVLTPTDVDQFDYILAGGILGDVDEHDPDRTQELRQHGFPVRHLGRVQMTADTAVLAAWRILEAERVPLDQLTFVDRPTFQLNAHEHLHMPFRYLRGPDGQPLLPPGMLDFWRHDAARDFILA